MDISIKEKTENPLLKRTEVRFTVEFDGATPSRKEVKEKLCAVLNSPPELTIIRELKQSFGSKRLLGRARVYADAEAVKVEHKHILMREKGEKVKKEKKEEKKAEEKK
jgi:small subunit ribosomal protein S24e